MVGTKRPQVTRYLKVTGTEEQINSLVQLAKFRQFKTEEVVFNPKVVNIVLALKRFVSHVKLLSGRWPCPECGRKNETAKLLMIECHLENGKSYFGGCWRCNIQPVLDEAEQVLSKK